MKVKENVDRRAEQDIIIEGLRKYGHIAYNGTLEKGIPATILKGDNICRIGPDGTVSFIEKIRKRNKKLRKTFKLK